MIMIGSRFLNALLISLAALVFVFVAINFFVHRLAHAPGTHPDTFQMYIAPGGNLSTVADYASVAGVVEKAWQFKLIAYRYGLEKAIYAGEYEVKTGLSPLALLEKISRQDTYKRRIVIPEGTTALQLEGILSNSFGLNMDGYIVPEEGSLLPETYFYERGDNAIDVIKRMQEAMAVLVEDLWQARAMDLPLKNKAEAIILASIVEKETGVAAERRDVAAVFTNRLNQGMRLQSDPTVVYGITGGLPLGRAISRRDLNTDTPYNSYRRSGLPPTPIANPGKQSIAAVLNPASTDYLYFVADGTGGHAFANNLADHNANVARWREIEKILTN